MHLTFLDWAILGLYFAVPLAFGVFFAKKSSSDASAFFVGGRSVPWWLAGSGMVAATFGTDGPLLMTGLVYQGGIAANWWWWSFALSGTLTVFLFAPLWRRAALVTDVEFAELRYSGRPAALLRGFRALYLVLTVHTLLLGWMTLALAKVLHATLGWSKPPAVLACLTVTVLYTALGGLQAVLWTGMLQLALAMGAGVLLAWFAVGSVGGLDALMGRVEMLDAVRGTHTLQIFPHTGEGFLLSFLVLLSVNWWSSWSAGPCLGAAPGGGGAVAQRLLSAKDEKHSVGAALLFNLMHYALRPWPWIVTALVALVLLPNAGDAEGAPVQVMVRCVPRSLRGLMLVGLVSAYLPTVAAYLNLSASYLVHDVYARFVSRGRAPEHSVAVGRAATVACAVLSGVVALRMDSIAGAWRLLMALGAGAGLVFLLRWLWWRVNAWSEIAAMTAAAAISLTLQSSVGVRVVRALRGWDGRLPAVPLNTADPHSFAWLMLLTTCGTTAVWIAVTLLTRPEPGPTLQAFYDRVKPPALGWRGFAPESARADRTLRWHALHWVLGSMLVYFALFGIGNLLFRRVADGLLMLVMAAACLSALVRSLQRRGWGVVR